ncbi:MAG: radical SAM protein [Bacteroidota bacterium]
MSRFPDFEINEQWILSHRTGKVSVDPFKPYNFIVEKERTSNGKIEDVATLFVTNRECPFRCLMCDLWKYTTDKTVPVGAIPEQIKWALDRLPETTRIKLYNSGSFFDINAIPEKDYQGIARLLKSFETVIVESHPKLVNEKCIAFNNLLNGKLEVALGLETTHPEILSRLNKKTNLTEFQEAVKFLTANGIASRAFILLRPPFLSEEEGITWAKNSIDFAFDAGVSTCVIIPTRVGNGAMEALQNKNYFTPPDIKSLEKVIEYGVMLNKGNVIADLWDLELFSSCDICFEERKKRLLKMNLYQKNEPSASCKCGV